MVDPRVIETLLSECKTDVLPLSLKALAVVFNVVTPTAYGCSHQIRTDSAKHNCFTDSPDSPTSAVSNNGSLGEPLPNLLKFTDISARRTVP